MLLQEEKAIERGILPLLQRATLVQTFGQRNHVCLKEGSITIPPYAPPQKMQTHLIPEKTPRSIFVYFRGLFYDVGNDPEGGYYARYVSLSLLVNKLVFEHSRVFIFLRRSKQKRSHSDKIRLLKHVNQRCYVLEIMTLGLLSCCLRPTTQNHVEIQ